MTPTLSPGQVWRPTRPGSRAKARTIEAVCMDLGLRHAAYFPADGDWKCEYPSAFYRWIARHVAVCEATPDHAKPVLAQVPQPRNEPAAISAPVPLATGDSPAADRVIRAPKTPGMRGKNERPA